MHTKTSRIPEFYKQGIERRRQLAANAVGLNAAAVALALEQGGLDAASADKTVENVLGTYALPFALGLNVMVNCIDHLAPMVVEEPSVVAAASHAARLVRAAEISAAGAVNLEAARAALARTAAARNTEAA